MNSRSVRALLDEREFRTDGGAFILLFVMRLLRLLANLNCLYYLSPAMRVVIQTWVHSTWCCLSCIGVAIDPQSMEEDD